MRKKDINYVLNEHVRELHGSHPVLNTFTEPDVAIELGKQEKDPSQDTAIKLMQRTIGTIWSLEAVKKSVELSWLKFDGDTPSFVALRQGRASVGSEAITGKAVGLCRQGCFCASVRG